VRPREELLAAYYPTPPPSASSSVKAVLPVASDAEQQAIAAAASDVRNGRQNDDAVVAGRRDAWSSAYALTEEGEYLAACDHYELIEESHCAYYWRYVYAFWQGADGTQFGAGALEDWSRRNRELRIGSRVFGKWAPQLARWGWLPKNVALTGRPLCSCRPSVVATIYRLMWCVRWLFCHCALAAVILHIARPKVYLMHFKPDKGLNA